MAPDRVLSGEVRGQKHPPRTRTTPTPAAGPSRASRSRCGASRGPASKPRCVRMIRCKVLTAAIYKPDLDVLLEPLRHGDPGHWEVVTRMRVLGVTLSGPDRPHAARGGDCRDASRARVVEPTQRLIAELVAGAKRSTAFFALTRFVLPNAAVRRGRLARGRRDVFMRFCELRRRCRRSSPSPRMDPLSRLRAAEDRACG